MTYLPGILQWFPLKPSMTGLHLLFKFLFSFATFSHSYFSFHLPQHLTLFSSYTRTPTVAFYRSFVNLRIFECCLFIAVILLLFLLLYPAHPNCLLKMDLPLSWTSNPPLLCSIHFYSHRNFIISFIAGLKNLLWVIFLTSISLKKTINILRTTIMHYPSMKFPTSLQHS